MMVITKLFNFFQKIERNFIQKLNEIESELLKIYKIFFHSQRI